MSAPYRILIADDDVTNREILVGSLEKAGYETLEASSGAEALEAVEQNHPDLVLLDVAMPPPDGIQVCKSLKSRQETVDIPIIFITSRSEPRDVERAFAAGGSDYVVKPFYLNEVKARISVHLQLYRTRRALEEPYQRLLHARLSKREIEILRYLADGLSSRAIARALHVSVRTVDNHRARVLQKLGAEGAADLTRLAVYVAIFEMLRSAVFHDAPAADNVAAS